jgi:hypothetical protein
MLEFEKVLECLNIAFENDPNAVHALIANRVPCNERLADHPTVEVAASNVEGLHFNVGALGLINGVLVALGLPKVAMVWDHSGSRHQFTGFKEYDQST